ncbi:hypothetical protein ABIA70_002232 [Arthrobacter sp. 754]
MYGTCMPDPMAGNPLLATDPPPFLDVQVLALSRKWRSLKGPSRVVQGSSQ